MKAWLYQEKARAEIGEVRWEVSADIVKPEVMGKVGTNEDIDIDNDLICKRWGFTDESKARKFAAEVTKRGDLAFGAVTLQKQEVVWFIREDGLAEWEDVGESEEVTA